MSCPSKLFPYSYVTLSLSVLFIFVINLNEICGDKVSVVELTTSWTLKNQDGSITMTGIKIPTSVYAVLSKTYGDVLQSKNDVNLRWIAYDNWTFTKHFNVNQEDFTNVLAINLTLYGIDTVSTVRLNGLKIGQTDNMFVCYYFDVLQYLRQENVLEIEIMSPIIAAKMLADIETERGKATPSDCESPTFRGECHRNMLRKMQMSFGSEVGPAVPSMGIWKTVTLEYYEVAVLRNVDIAVKQNVTHWMMDINAFFSTAFRRDFYGNISLYAPDLLKEYPYAVGVRTISYKSPKINFVVPVPKESVELWWPNGYGNATLYPIFIRATCWADTQTPKLRAKTTSQKLVKIGFRTVELIEEIQDGQGRTFYFKVNGVPIFVKGAVYLPAHILPEDYADADLVDYILNAAHDANMNLIRVWGGGLYESETFYNSADRLGLMVWQEMAFTTSAYPVTNSFMESVRLETAENAKYLASHPSLVLIVTNNEVELFLIARKCNDTALNTTNCSSPEEFLRLEEEYNQLFRGTIRPELNIISRNAYDARPGPMMSTPSKGIEENKKVLPLDAQSVNYGDVHFWGEQLDGCNADIYPRARFISQYGFQSIPPISSWIASIYMNASTNATTNVNDEIIELIKHRQHNIKGMQPMLQLIERHMPFEASNWTQDLDALIYFSQVTQALAAKTATDLFRSQRVKYRTMGAIYWHLNDLWVAPSWSMIDYYGNYKLLYYWSREFLLPHSIIALYDATNNQLNITLSREEVTTFPDARKYTETIKIFYWNKLLSKKNFTRDEILETDTIQQRSVKLEEIISPPFTVRNCFLQLELTNTKEEVVASTFYLPSNLKDIEGVLDPKITAQISWRYCNEENISPTRIIAYSLTVYVSAPALFVFIQIVHPKIKRYKLSENGFIQTVPVKIVHLEYEHNSECMEIADEDIKVLTLNKYLLAAEAELNKTETRSNKKRRKRSRQGKARMEL